MDFMTAKSEADGFAEQRRINNEKMAKVIINSMVSDVNKNRKNLAVSKNKLNELLKMFPMEDRLEIMIDVFLRMC